MIATPDVSWIAIGPDMALAFGAAFVLLVEVQWRPAAKVLGLIAGGAVAVGLYLTVLQWWDFRLGLGGPAFGDLIVVDGLAIFSRFALLGVTGLGVLSGWRLIEGLGRRGAEALALVLLASAGFSIMVASNNLVMMFMGLEVGSIALYVLAGMTRERSESDEAAIKYFLLGSFASAVFVYGVALLYAGTGSMGVIDIREFLNDYVVTDPAVIYVGLGLIVAGLGFKVSAAPFHTWAPDVYQGAPAGFVGFMAAVAKIAGFAALVRILLSAVGDLDGVWLPMVAGVAALSMLVGSVFALVQGDVRRMLAYSGVAHAGFIMTGVVGGSTTGVLFYVVVYAIQLVGAFAIVAAVGGGNASGSSVEDYRGLAKRSPILGASFAILLLGMAGLPVTSGFIAKFGVFTDAWTAGFEWLVIVAVVASVVAFAFYLRVIVVMYMDRSEGNEIVVASSARWVVWVAVAATLVWGVFPGSLLQYAVNALPF